MYARLEKLAQAKNMDERLKKVSKQGLSLSEPE
jgi:hypothetical protein